MKRSVLNARVEWIPQGDTMTTKICAIGIGREVVNTAVVDDVWVPIITFCKYLGLKDTRYEKRLIMECGLRTEEKFVENPAGARRMLCIHISHLERWLMTINIGRIPKAKRGAFLNFRIDMGDLVHNNMNPDNSVEGTATLFTRYADGTIQSVVEVGEAPTEWYEEQAYEKPSHIKAITDLLFGIIPYTPEEYSQIQEVLTRIYNEQNLDVRAIRLVLEEYMEEHRKESLSAKQVINALRGMIDTQLKLAQ